MQLTLMKNIIIVIIGALIVFFVISKVSYAPVPTTTEENIPIAEISTTPKEIALNSEKGVVIYVTLPNTKVATGSPLQISGRAPGNWFFEASAPVTLTNWDGLIIGESFVTAEGDWMTTDYVPFKGEIIFPEGNLYNRGFLIFKKDNASGEPQFDDSAELQVTIK